MGRSLSHYVVLARKRLIELSKSGQTSDRLLSFNIIVFILLATLIITHLIIQPASIYSLQSFFILLISFLGSIIIGTFVYGSILEIIANLTKDKIGPLRLSAIILLLDLPIAGAGLSFHIPILINIAIGVIFIQLFVILWSAFFTFPIIGAQDSKTERGQLRMVLGDVGSIVSIISPIITIILFIFGK